MVIREGIQRLQSMYSKGVQSKDSRLSNRHAYKMLLTGRATIFSQQSSKGQSVSVFNYQTLPCVELIIAPLAECPCIPKNSTILRTKHPLPKPISGLENDLIKSVTTVGGAEKFDKISYENVKHYASGNKYTSGKPGYYIRNSYLYLINLKLLKGLDIIGLFEDPIEAYNFPTSCEGLVEKCNCVDVLDFDFPVDEKSMRGVLDIAQNEMILFAQMREDKLANASDDNNSNSQMIHR